MECEHPEGEDDEREDSHDQQIFARELEDDRHPRRMAGREVLAVETQIRDQVHVAPVKDRKIGDSQRIGVDLLPWVEGEELPERERRLPNDEEQERECKRRHAEEKRERTPRRGVRVEKTRELPCEARHASCEEKARRAPSRLQERVERTQGGLPGERGQHWNSQQPVVQSEETDAERGGDSERSEDPTPIRIRLRGLDRYIHAHSVTVRCPLRYASRVRG